MSVELRRTLTLYALTMVAVGSTIGEDLEVSREVRVDVADNAVIVADAGLGMNREDIDKLVSIALTDKREMSGVRGYRGIGFWSANTGGEQVVVDTTKF